MISLKKYIFVFGFIFAVSNSIAETSSNESLKELVKTQRDKLISVENSLKKLTGQIESQKSDFSLAQMDKLNSRINNFIDSIKILESKLQTLTEFSYRLEFQIKRLETHFNLSSSFSDKKLEIPSPSKLDKNNKKSEVNKNNLKPSTSGVLGYINEEKNVNEKKVKNLNQSKKVKSGEETNNNKSVKKSLKLSPEEEFRIAKNFIAKREYENAEKAFKEFLNIHNKHKKSADARYWLGRTYYIQKKYSEAALALAEFNNLYPDDKRYEETTLLIAESAVKFAPKEQMCGILTQTREFMINPSKKFQSRITKLINKHNCSDE